MKKNRLQNGILLALMLGASQFLCGQPALEKFKFSKIEVNSGLSNSNITCFLQDSNGFLWIGTRDGLNKYDGYDFKVYRNDQEDTTTLLKNNIYYLYQDVRGTIWISTRGGGFHYYDSLSDRFVRINEFSSYCVIAHISEDKNKNLWIAGIRKGQAFAAQLDRSTMRWKYHEIFPSIEPVTFLKHHADNEFWIGVRRTGFYKWNAQTNIAQKYSPDDKNPEAISPGFLKAVSDGSQNLWMVTSAGLTRFNIPSEKFTNYTTSNTKDQPALNVVLDICHDDDYVWIGTENGGLIRMDTRTAAFRNFHPDKNEPSSLSDNSIWSVYKDRQGRIWIGTFSKGVSVLDNMKEKFSELNVPLENDIVNAIYKDSKGRMWIGTEGGLVVKDRNNKVRSYKHDPEIKGSLGSNPVLSIYEDSDNTLWFGTWSSGLERYDEVNDRFIHHNFREDDEHSIASPNVFSIRERAKTKELLVSSFRGLNVMVDKDKGTFERHHDDRHVLNNNVTVIYEDSQGNVWLGTNAELNLYDIETRKRTRYYVGSLNDSTTIGGYINCILEDTQGRLWIGASNGLHMLKDKVYVTRYTTKNGLPNNIIRGILEDGHGNLWLSTTQGLSMFDPRRETFKNYDVSDGLLGNEFKPNACFKSQDGYLFFGGTGVIVFHPDSLNSNPHVPNVFITDLKLFNESVPVGDKDNILSQHISKTKEIRLPHDYNLLTLNYVALNFTASHKNQYAYRLKGFNDNWTDVKNQRSATFTNLDPGTYVFQVIASNNDGYWNEAGASLTIHVLPPWSATVWFRTTAFVALAGAAFAFYKLRVRNIERRNQRLKQLVAERTNELLIREEEIKKQNVQLVLQRNELVTQNEELIGSQEEISAQRDLVALQNQELQAARAIIEAQNQKIQLRNETLEKEVAKRTKTLSEYNQQLEQFAFISAHNLRAPVARILGLGQLLELSSKGGHDTSDISDKIVSTTRELDRVVRDLNTILEVRKDNALTFQHVDFESELMLVKGALEKEIQESGAMLIEDFSAARDVKTVKPYLNSILTNLVSNAIKYRHENRSPIIRISTSVTDEHVCLTVNDNGSGIDLSAIRDKLFVLYSRFHLHVDGKGMGLYLIKTQITAMGGRIEVDSEIDQGTTFRVFFRLNPEEIHESAF